MTIRHLKTARSAAARRDARPLAARPLGSARRAEWISRFQALRGDFPRCPAL